MSKNLKPKKKGLGRGLNALFEDEESVSITQEPAASESGGPEQAPAPAGQAANQAANNDVSLISEQKRLALGVDQMKPCATQPRQNFDEASIAQLAESIKTHGLLQPILVRPSKLDGSEYEIIAGERRWRAAQVAGLHVVPTIILNLSDVEMLEVALVENLQREDLNPVDEARGYQRLMSEYKHTQEQLSDVLGKSRSHIANMVRLLGLPEKVLVYLEEGKLMPGHARPLIGLKNAENLAAEIVQKKLSVRAAERLASAANGRPAKKSYSGKAASTKDSNTIALEEDMTNKLGMRVTIDAQKNNSGTLRIDYKSLDQLDELLRKLSSEGSSSRLSD